MAAPTIDTTTSILAYRVGEFFVYQPYASDTPTSWAATGLPAGLAINGTTGKISGAGTEPGVYNVGLTATNGTGTSAPLVLAIGIETSDYRPDAFVEIDVDLITGRVSLVGGNVAEGVVLFGKKGDTLLLSVGFKKGGVLQDLALSVLTYVIKQYDPEGVLIQSVGDFEKVGSYESTRYRIVATLTADVLAPVLSDYDADEGTSFPAVSELRWGVLHTLPGDEDPTEFERSSQNFTTAIWRDLAPDLT